MDEATAAETVLPSLDDPIIRAASEGLGGPAGRRVSVQPGRAIAWLLALTALACSLALVQKQPCREDGWTEGNVYPMLCYSDIPLLYSSRGLATADPVYEIAPGRPPLEYPVLTGTVVTVTVWVTNLLQPDAPPADRNRTFFDVNVLFLVACALAATWFIARTAGRRPWDAALFALAPGLVATAYINWDLFAVALTAGALYAWSRRAPTVAGLLLGLAVAAKFYPVVLVGPLFLLCLRAGRLGAFARLLVAAVAAFVAVNLPVALRYPDGWAEFYRLSRERGVGLGSLWYALAREGHPVPESALNLVSGGVFAVFCLGIAWLALRARRRPRLGQLAFLVVLAFTVANKVYSPQYVLWLIALFALARPRWRDLLVWQAAEVLYFVAIWWHLEGYQNTDITVPEWTHTGATLLRIAAQLWVASLVVRDVWRPEHDPVRATGDDDPAGGVLTDRPDSFALVRVRTVPAPSSP